MRFVCVTDLFTLARPEAHPHGMDEAAFAELYTEDKPVLFNFHGYASAVHQLIHRRPAQERFTSAATPRREPRRRRSSCWR